MQQLRAKSKTLSDIKYKYFAINNIAKKTRKIPSFENMAQQLEQ